MTADGRGRRGFFTPERFGWGLALAVMLVSGIAFNACGEEGVQVPVTLELFHVIAGLGNNSATGIAVDTSGNVYVAGDFEGSADFDGDGIFDVTGRKGIFIGKYGASGNLLWVKTAAAMTCGADTGMTCGRGYGVTVDGSGNTYLTGYFGGSVDFDQDGNSDVNSTGSTDVFVAKYDASGILQWVRSAGGPSEENAQDIAVDSAGNSYVAGSFTESADFNGDGESDLSGLGKDVFVAKYDSSGNLLWVKVAGGTGDDAGGPLAVDAAGNAYLTGWFQDAADFDRDGTADVTSAGGGFDSGYGIAVDDDGSAYVTGLFQGGAEFSDYDMFIAKYDQNGVLKWVKSLHGHRDGSPNIAGTGDIFVAKYDQNGAFRWLRSAGGSGSDAGRAIAVDGAGNAYITGWFDDGADFDEDRVADVSGAGIFVAKYGSDGTLGWVNSVTRSDDGNGRGIAVNGTGRAYVTGYFVGSLDLDGDGAADLTSAGEGDIFILVTR